MTPLAEAKQGLYRARPWVMWWVAGTQQEIRFAHEEMARKASRIHNMHDESGSGTYSQVVYDPEGERFPRDA